MASKRIILLLDGTWNDLDVGPRDTNIVRLQTIFAKTLGAEPAPIAKLAAQPEAAPNQQIVSGYTTKGDGGDVEHIVFYERGVGTGALDRLGGGILGRGLARNVRRAYKFLSYYYAPGDQIFIFGFSRGAFTARSLVGFVAAAGLLTREACTIDNEAKAWAYYRTAPNDRLPGEWAALTPHVHGRTAVQVACLGVFDTVGALGIPLGIFWRSNRQRSAFHDVNLSSIVKVNLHAVAIDEHRRPFEAAVWRKPRFKHFASHTEQVWFAGAHADIGGGYIDESKRKSESLAALDDISLDWMLKRLRFHFPELLLDGSHRMQLSPAHALAPQHEARKLYYRFAAFSLRSIANSSIPHMAWHERNVCYDRHADPVAEMVHVSALERLGANVQCDNRTTRYRPKNLLHALGAIKTTYAAERPKEAGPDILLVDWSGDVLDCGNPQHQARAQTIVAAAEERLR